MIGRLIREAAALSAKDAVSVDLLSATVEGVSPLTLRVDERMLLTEEHLLLPAYLKQQTLHIGGTYSGSTLLRKDFAAGDKLILLAVNGRYLVVGKEEEDAELQLTVT